MSDFKIKIAILVLYYNTGYDILQEEKEALP